MHRNVKRACAVAAVSAAVAALASGLADPAAATAAPTAMKSAERHGQGTRLVTLITGDRAVLDAKGRFLGLQRAKGRERVPVQVRTSGGHTLVIPMDAASMVASGALDQRLFDVTALDKAATRTSRRDGLKVIVGYRGAARAVRSEVRDTGTLSATFTSLDADAVQTPVKDTPALWKAVTDGDRTAAGIAHVWLDGVRKASLDKSVPQIGAPTAWAKGYTGKGVKVAVLDTGIDTTHPDLKTQVIAAKNFTTARDTSDHFGHGTHVASIIAGTGAKSGGKYKGVAPGAELLNAKVLDDEGSGDDASILAGMEWAAAQGADIVNLSLGGADTPGIDPLEAEVNKLSETKGMLFAIAAGNEGEGGDSTVDSPGSAADALTVGAVDGSDKLAYFSSRGPSADNTLKPDVTAPGVKITAAAAKGSYIDKEVGENPAGYLTISGTSMATPHVAGAAAILKQEHPDWTWARLKATLVGSAKGGDYTAFQGGAGRIQVDKAIAQTVVAEPSSLDFPLQEWPHTANTPVTKQLTYRNSGASDITLSLSARGFAPKGTAAPAGFFTLGASTVTVPAGGTASVGVTVDARLGGGVNGGYSARVTATGGGQTVSTSVGVVRETEHYRVTLKYINRPGQTPKHVASLMSVDGLGAAAWLSPVSTADTVVVRVPRGKYTLESASAQDLDTYKGGLDWLIQPELDVTRNTTVTLDQNKAKAPDITVPDPAAEPKNAWVGYHYYPGQNGANGNGVLVHSFSDIRVAHIGPAVDYLTETWSGQWTKGADTEYDTGYAAPVKRITPYVRHYRAGDFATLNIGMGASSPGKTGAVVLTGSVPDGYGFASAGTDAVTQKLPGTRSYHVSAVDGVQWRPDFYQFSAKKDADGNAVPDEDLWVDDYMNLKAGRTYQQRFNAGVFGLRVTSSENLFRTGNKMSAQLFPFVDGAGHAGDVDVSSATSTLYRNGVKIGSNTDPLMGKEQFTVPAGDAVYRLTASVRRAASVGRAGSRIDASWTFRSKKPADELPHTLPASVVRFAVPTSPTSTVPAGRTTVYPVTVQGAAKGTNLKALAVWVSYDHGRTWKKVTVTHGRVTVKNPAKGRSVALRAKVTDKRNNTSTITLYDAYYGG
ncbi:S8 family peptidase [Streptomyces sp. NPDC101175]|uniref:S8 family peptidase n=1 Tax=Streptomyces sp. NPDC101175 TaxID=3366123 RepID=UPI003834F897